MATTETKVLAQALYEIRLLLGGYLGSEIEADISVRTAAHLAYALHNDALAVLDGGSFDVADALRRVEAMDSILGIEHGAYFTRTVNP